jgi:O-glycosyl hydrolase
MARRLETIRTLLAVVALGPVCAPGVTEVEAGEPGVNATVDFANLTRDWDGFGVNYVELAQSLDYEDWPQEYGGFSLLSEEERQEILDMIFGEDGLKPGIVKMFFDPFQQEEPSAPFDHERTTRWMRYFVREGLKKTRDRGADLQIITTLYGPPAWATKQKFIRGRDLDPTQNESLARYITAWVRYLRTEEEFPVDYVSIHNEGDSPSRWPVDGKSGNIGTGHDYNAWWRPWTVAGFLPVLRSTLDEAGLKDVGVTPGECTVWRNFSEQRYDWAILDSPKAFDALGLVTSHGFGSADAIRSTGIDLLRTFRPELHAWTTSMSWAGMDVDSLDLIRLNIYKAKVNAVIPWAAVQTLTWVGGDPNPGTAFRVSADGDYDVMAGYWFYKQVSRAGQPGMSVVPVTTTSGSGVELMGFAGNGTKNPDAVVVLNTVRWGSQPIRLRVLGSDASSFRGYLTTGNLERKYEDLGSFDVEDGYLKFDLPARSAMTLLAE